MRAVLASESLFTYPTGMSSGDFSNLSFVPVFLDEIPSLSSAQEVCGNDSQMTLSTCKHGTGIVYLTKRMSQTSGM